MGIDIEFVILTCLIVVAAFMLIQWRDSASSSSAPKYSVVKAGNYPVSDPINGYPAGRQGAAFTARTPGDFETFKSEDKRLVPIAPLGILNPSESLARLQKQEAESELMELQQIREKQQAASVSLLPNELDASVSALVDRNLLLNRGPVSGQAARTGLRNGSLDIRRSPQIERTPVSIWQISTLDGEGYRRPLE
jgi:hypothetical protein